MVLLPGQGPPLVAVRWPQLVPVWLQQGQRQAQLLLVLLLALVALVAQRAPLPRQQQALPLQWALLLRLR